MTVKLIAVKCPECNADLSVEEGRLFAFCTYCGIKVMIHNENEYIYRHVDEAALKKVESDHIVHMRELDRREKTEGRLDGLKLVLTVIWLILSLIILVICIVKWAAGGEAGWINGFLMLFYLGGPVIGGGAYLIFKLIPEKETERGIQSNGGIRFPKGLEPFWDKDYSYVHSSLRNAGFRNITCMNLHDIRIGLLQKPGKVETITVNGEAINTGGKVYYPDTPIVITYHGK